MFFSFCFDTESYYFFRNFLGYCLGIFFSPVVIGLIIFAADVRIEFMGIPVVFCAHVRGRGLVADAVSQGPGIVRVHTLICIDFQGASGRIFIAYFHGI
jgi:hypothetical protein